MSEIDALRELNDLKAALSYEFWDNAALVSLAAVFIGVVGEFAVTFTPWLKGAWKEKVAKASTLILIAGLGGDMVTYAKNSAINGTIIGLLNKEAGVAYEEGAKANERAKALEKSNLELRKDLAETQKELDAAKLALQNQGGRISSVEQKEAPLAVDEDELRRAMRRLPRSLRTVTLMRLTDPVAGPSADHIKAALQSLKPPFKVSIVKLAASEFRGIIVCQRSADDVKVGNALKNAAIVSEIKPMTFAPECKQIQQATYEDGGRGFLFNADPRVDGTVIFVGHPGHP